MASLPACCWHHCKHCTVIVARVAPALLPLLHGHLFLCLAGIVNLVAPMLLPALQTGVCPVQSSCNTLVYMTLLPFSLSLPVVLLLYLALFHSYWALGQCSAGASAAVALVSLLTCCWHHCQHPTVVVASIAPVLLPLLHGRLSPCHVGIVNCILPALLPALQTGICQVTTQLQHIGVRDAVAILLIAACGFVTIPGVLPRQLGLQPMWHWHLCWL
jgi:hypothetical protein